MADELPDLHRLDVSTVRSPGLTEGWQDIPLLAASLHKQLQILSYKKRIPALWVVLVGGTGTGKSTLFNSLCGMVLSETGVERPKTSGPILYAHESCRIGEGMPFSAMEVTVRRTASGGENKPTAGLSGHFIVLEHGREDFSHLILADTPDLDSVELPNRQVAEDLYHLADAVVFVTSQEKYADEIPYLFLLRVLKEQRLTYLILNKAQESTTTQDVLSALQGADPPLKSDRIWLLPYAPNATSHAIAHHPVFKEFQALFFTELSKARLHGLRRKIFAYHKKTLYETRERLMALTAQENLAAQAWLKTLRHLEQESSEAFLKDQRKTLSSTSQDVLKGEIRKLFSRYDVLAKPRRVIKETLLSPFRLIGILGRSDERKHREELRHIRRKMDLMPIQAAVEKFNRLVLERLPPSDEEAPLFKRLREPDTALSPGNIKSLVWKAQDQLDEWLENRFETLAKSLPKTKRWGIHTTSILWGILIVSLEVTVGGGFSILDAALDSALAPFVTKGVVELFAYHEIQKITRELAERYQEELLSVMQAQRKRYERALQSVLLSSDAVRGFEELGQQITLLSEV
jgi:energy-coupling factor transporter ATP-binding protein EcfA2